MAKQPIDNTIQINLNKSYAKKHYPAILKQAFVSFKADMTEEEQKEPYRIKNIYIKTSDLSGFRDVVLSINNFTPNIVPMRRLEDGSDNAVFELFFEFEKVDNPEV